MRLNPRLSTIYRSTYLVLMMRRAQFGTFDQRCENERVLRFLAETKSLYTFAYANVQDTRRSLTRWIH